MANGMITILIVPTIRSRAQATTPITIRRQHHAAAIRSPCGTSASSRLEVELCRSTGGSAPKTEALGGAVGPGTAGDATRAASDTPLNSSLVLPSSDRADSCRDW